MKKTIAAAILLSAFAASAGDAASRHSESGSYGINGVKERLVLKVNKSKSGSDALSLQVDLGEHKYDSAKSQTL